MVHGVAIVRQFLRGDPNGPITDRKEGTTFAEDLLGDTHERHRVKAATRSRRHRAWRSPKV